MVGFIGFIDLSLVYLILVYPITLHVSCDLLGHPGPEIYLGGRHSSQARDYSSLPLPPALMGGIKYPSTWARNIVSPPLYYSGGAEGSIGGGGSSGKYSPTPTGLSLHLNPTTLAMLQQHNYIPYFRGINKFRLRLGRMQTVD